MCVCGLVVVLIICTEFLRLIWLQLQHTQKTIELLFFLQKDISAACTTLFFFFFFFLNKFSINWNKEMNLKYFFVCVSLYVIAATKN